MTNEVKNARSAGDMAGSGMRAAARRAVAAVQRAGVEAYDRSRHLPRLLPIGPAEIADARPEAHRSIVARLARALRAERSRGRAGHWTYDINRHIGLKQAYEAERRALREGDTLRALQQQTAANPSGRRP